MRIGLAIPLLNEGPLVRGVTQRILEVAARDHLHLELCLVDNGSSDDTRAQVTSLAAGYDNIHAVLLDQNAGYGGGILAGVRYLIDQTQPDLIGWAWGDGQVDPGVLSDLAQACAAGAMLAKAQRIERRDGWQRFAVTKTYAATMRLLGVRTPDVNGCPKLLRREAWEALAPQSTDWFLDAEVVLATEERGWEITNAPVVMQARTAGQSKVRLSTSLEFVVNLTRWWRGERPPFSR